MPDIYKDNSPRVVDKSASYQVLPADIGSVIVATGAITVTLPAVADVWNGWNIKVFNGANNNLTITAPSGKLVTFNNTAATSAAFSTTSEKVGAGAEIIYDSALTKYLLLVMAEETQTMSVT